MANTEREAAQELTAFLTKRDNYQRTSALETMVQGQISAMAREIAAAVVAENPGLKEAIRDLVQRVISESMRDDAYLQGVIVKAVSQALGQLIAERGDDRG